jgi:hypothetical protein
MNTLEVSILVLAILLLLGSGFIANLINSLIDKLTSK